MESSEIIGFIIIFSFLVPIFWGAYIGEKVGLKYWLYDSFEGFSASFGPPFGALLIAGVIGAYSDNNSSTEGVNVVYMIFFLLGLYMVLLNSVKLYKISVQQAYTKSDAIGLFLGKLAFGMLTLGLIVLLAFMFSQRKRS